MGRLNAALNQLAERGVFAIGPVPSAKVNETRGEQLPQAEGEPEVASAQGSTHQVAAADTEKEAESRSDVAAPSDDADATSEQPPQPASAFDSEAGSSEIETKLSAAANTTPITSRFSNAEQVAIVSEPASIEIPDSPSVQLVPSVDSSVTAPTEIVDDQGSVATDSESEETNEDESSRAAENRGESQQTEARGEQVEFNVPSHLFDTTTADMDELRAQLDVLTQAERSALGSDREYKPAGQEILLPVVPQPLAVVTDDVSPAVETDEDHETGPQVGKVSDLPQAAKSQPIETVESEAETPSETRIEERETTSPRIDQFATETPDSQPEFVNPVNAETPNGSAYKPVLDTWFDLPADHIGTSEVDDPADPSAKEQLILREPSESVSSPAVELEQLSVKEQNDRALSGGATLGESGLRGPEIGRTPPTEFEVVTAGRLLQTEFGERIQQLSEQITAQLSIGEPQAVLLCSMKPDRQRAEAIAGLGMYVCAQQILPTLLVDADTNEKQITRDFAKHGPGLMEAIGDQVLWSDVVKGTSCDKLQLLPCGTDFGIEELDQRDVARLSDLIDQWKQRYGLVIIDGGLTESKLGVALARYADATFLSVQLGATNREELLAATQQLAQAGARLKGCITTGPVSS